MTRVYEYDIWCFLHRQQRRFEQSISPLMEHVSRFSCCVAQTLAPPCGFIGAYTDSCSEISYAYNSTSSTCVLSALCLDGSGTNKAASCSSTFCSRYQNELANVGGVLSCVGALDGLGVCSLTVRFPDCMLVSYV